MTIGDDLPDHLRNAAYARWFGLDDHKEGWQAEVLGRMGEEWERTGMPMAPWHALRWAMDYNLPIPSWVVSFLYGRAKRLQEIMTAPDSDVPEVEAVGRAFGFGGTQGDDDFSAKAARDSRYFRMAVRVVHKHEREQHKKTAVMDEVAKEFGVSRSTVSTAYKQYGDAARVFVSQMYVSLTRNL